MKQIRKRAHEKIMEHIVHEITHEKLKPGDQLPTERALAKEFQVSRTTVRKALKELEEKGVLLTRQGSGSFIKKSHTDWLETDLIVPILSADRKMLFEMLELRITIEAECAYLASKRATAEDLQVIYQAFKQMKEAGHHQEAGLKADVNFHLAIVRAAHNSLFSHLVQTVRERMHETIRTTRTQRLADPQTLQSTIDEHEALFLAIAAGQAEKAKQLMSHHIRQIRAELAYAFLKEAESNKK